MTLSQIYPIGTPGTPWGPAEVSQWRARQVRQRSYADDVLSAIEALSPQFTLEQYGSTTMWSRISLICTPSKAREASDVSPAMLDRFVSAQVFVAAQRRASPKQNPRESSNGPGGYAQV
jgi:hypothetical protein